MNPLPGVTGTLLPGRFLVDSFVQGGTHGLTGDHARMARRLRAWWASVEALCGPTTAMRTLFDLVAMPLFGMLGFKAHQCEFLNDGGHGWLETRGGTAVALVLRPWATHPQARTRELTDIARHVGASWGFVLAPPFLSLVDMRGHATRRALDFALPAVHRGAGIAPFILLAGSPAFDRGPAGAPAPIEATVARAAEYQDRVCRDLQYGVLAALDAWTDAIGNTRHAGLRRSRGPSTTGEPAPRDQALALVYRVLFLLFAESRGLVPHEHPLYRAAYAMSTLCHDALANAPTGCWDGLAATTRLARLGCDSRDLMVAPFNGPLFARAAAPALEGMGPSPRRRRQPAVEGATRRALVALASRSGRAGRETISFRDLGVDQLGAVYERVLDVGPSGAAPSATARTRQHSQARKQSGTFYTPQALTDFVVRRTLAPLVRGATPERILGLRILDPAMGSGAFLVTACRYLAGAYERALIDEGRASIIDIDDDTRAGFRRLVAEQCLAGVDVNPTAVQLARLSLWLTTLARGKPLSFLDHRLRVGNSLLGAWPDDLQRIADRPARRTGALPLLETDELTLVMQRVIRPLGTLLTRHDDSVRDVRSKEAAWHALSSEASPLADWRHALDLWCARWFWPEAAGLPPGASEVRALLGALLHRDGSLPPSHLADRLRATAGAAAAHGFFHWPLEFADVFYDAYGQPRQAPGFDAVVSNPPWEMLRSDSRRVSDTRDDAAPGSPRDNRATVRFIRESGAYPSCDRGHVNLYQPFLDRALALTRSGGRYGLVFPWGLAADDGATRLRARLLDRTSLDTLVGIDNARGVFPIHRGMRFVVVTGTTAATTTETDVICGLRGTDELDALPGLRTPERASAAIRLTPSDIETLGGPARRFPDLRHAAEVAWRQRIARLCPRLGDRDGWHASFGRELNATEAQPYFSPVGLPVLEGKHIDAFTATSPADARRITPDAAARLLPARPFTRPRLAYRDVSAVGNRATLIAAVVPAGVVTSHTLFCLRTPLPLERQYFLCAVFNSFVASALVRAVMAGHITTSIIESLPVPRWSADRRCRIIAGIARRLSRGLPSQLARARLQAIVASMYGVTPAEFRGILETFPLVPIEERTRTAAILEGLTA